MASLRTRPWGRAGWNAKLGPAARRKFYNRRAALRTHFSKRFVVRMHELSPLPKSTKDE
jgi:hypothetical protein